MQKSLLLSVRISHKLGAKLDKLAKRGGRSKSWYVNRMLEDNVDHEMKIVEMVLEGQRDIEAGRVISHEEAMASLRERIRSRRKRAA